MPWPLSLQALSRPPACRSPSGDGVNSVRACRHVSFVGQCRRGRRFPERCHTRCRSGGFRYSVLGPGGPSTSSGALAAGERQCVQARLQASLDEKAGLRMPLEPRRLAVARRLRMEWVHAHATALWPRPRRPHGPRVGLLLLGRPHPTTCCHVKNTIHRRARVQSRLHSVAQRKRLRNAENHFVEVASGLHGDSQIAQGGGGAGVSGVCKLIGRPMSAM